jgi:hypothetical protein
MLRRTAPPPLEDPAESTEDDGSPEAAKRTHLFGPGGPAVPDLAALPIAGITQRRLAIMIGALIAAWIVLLFARQVGDASAASGRAEAMVVENAARHAEIAGLERELDRIQQRRFVLLEARAHGLGGHREIAFTLDPDAPPLPEDAPGSAALRVGAPPSVSPLESWLNILIGSSD